MSGELQNTPGGSCVRQGCFSCLSAFSLRITSVACHPPMAPPLLRLISDKCGNVCQIPDKHICAIRIYNTATGSPAHNIVLSGISTSLSASTCFYIAFYLPFLPFFLTLRCPFTSGSALASATPVARRHGLFLFGCLCLAARRLCVRCRGCFILRQEVHVGNAQR